MVLMTPIFTRLAAGVNGRNRWPPDRPAATLRRT
jgi:hypothetical protein